jgi:hypothetical protein
MVTMPPANPPPGVQRNLEGVVARLFRLSQSPAGASARLAFSDHFLDRFGTGVRVPYRRAVDDVVGAGLIDLEKANANTSSLSHGDKADELLEGLVLRARALGTTEVAISDGEVDQLTDPARRALGIDTDVLFAVDEQSGRVELATMSTTALSGQALVRHWEQLPEAFFDSVLKRTDIAGRHVEPVELWCFPRVRPILDVMHAPHITERYISLGFAGTSKDCLTLDDIELIHDGSRVWLLALDSEDPLVIRNLSMVNYPRHLSRDAQTLITIGREMERDWTPFNWGSQSVRDFLPGIVYRGIRVSKAIWRFPKHLCRKELSSVEWCKEFERWRDTVGLPQWMEFGSGDNLLPFDTTDLSEFPEIRRCLRKDSPVAFESGRAMHNQKAVEYVQHVSRPPVEATDAPRHFGSAPPYIPPSARRDWLGFELVGAREQPWPKGATLRLRNLARSLGIRDWHFVVYNDPDPHTRLRFHTGHHTAPSVELLREALIREIGSSVRNVREVPFFPEYQRYGGEESFGSIAGLFTESSDMALRTNLEPNGGESRLEAGCLSAIQLMERLLGSQWTSVVGSALSTHKSPHARKRDRKDRDEVLARLPVRGNFDGEPIFGIRSSNNYPVGVALSVLHMHANRMFAADREEEAQMLSVLRSHIFQRKVMGES